VRQRTGATRLGDDALGGAAADAGDLIEPAEGGQHGSVGGEPGAWAGAAIGVYSLGGGDRRDQLFDPGSQPVSLGAEPVDLVQQHPGQTGVMVIEPASERLDQGGVLGAHPAPGQAGEDLRVAFTSDQRLDHVPGRDGGQRAGHRRHLNQGIFQQLLQPGVVPGALAGQVGSQPGVIAQPADLGGRHKAGPQHPPLGQLR